MATRTENAILSDAVAREAKAADGQLEELIRRAAHPDALAKVRDTGGLVAHAQALVTALTDALTERAAVDLVAAKYGGGK